MKCEAASDLRRSRCHADRLHSSAASGRCGAAWGGVWRCGAVWGEVGRSGAVWGRGSGVEANNYVLGMVGRDETEKV